VVDHEFPDDSHDHLVDEWDAVDVRRVQPYQADKVYRCPGCDHEIRVGEGHVVVVPVRTPADRRHWHGACWDRLRARRARAGAPARLALSGDGVVRRERDGPHDRGP